MIVAPQAALSAMDPRSTIPLKMIKCKIIYHLKYYASTAVVTHTFMLFL